MSELRLAPISPRDAAAIARAGEVIRASFATVAQEFGITPESSPTHPAFLEDAVLRSSLLARTNVAIGAYIGEEMVGFVMVRLSDEAGAGEILRLSVLPECRHQGLGAHLLSSAEAVIRHRGLSAVTVGVAQEDTVLCDWYVQRGYTLQHTMRYPKLPFTVALYSKSFDSANN